MLICSRLQSKLKGVCSLIWDACVGDAPWDADARDLSLAILRWSPNSLPILSKGWLTVRICLC